MNADYEVLNEEKKKTMQIGLLLEHSKDNFFASLMSRLRYEPMLRADEGGGGDDLSAIHCLLHSSS